MGKTKQSQQELHCLSLRSTTSSNCATENRDSEGNP